jgi:hypothetical protein
MSDFYLRAQTFFLFTHTSFSLNVEAISIPCFADIPYRSIHPDQTAGHSKAPIINNGRGDL